MTIAGDSKRLDDKICVVLNKRKIHLQRSGAPTERGGHVFLNAPENALLDWANFLRCDWSEIANGERHERAATLDVLRDHFSSEGKWPNIHGRYLFSHAKPVSPSSHHNGV
ncbi:LOW QUALITY PROTEIN: hypothetical protein HZS_4602 [Henneguya salminicola]|nr:LOW QUALITY PROTEIN: hypothetical protein HZS_4602 [Henneguya salminicola]